jgi:hypothetical protein
MIVKLTRSRRAGGSGLHVRERRCGFGTLPGTAMVCSLMGHGSLGCLAAVGIVGVGTDVGHSSGRAGKVSSL